MSEYNKRFIALPMQLFLDANGLPKQIHYRDILTYVTLRSFNNSKNNRCFPSYETLEERSGMCRSYIIKSLKRLKLIGVIDIKEPDKKHHSNQYSFEPFNHFERIPFEIFDADLSSCEKAMLLCLRLISNGVVIFKKNVPGIAKTLGISTDTIYPLMRNLKKKGYIAEANVGKSKVYSFTDKLNWYYNYEKKDDSKAKPLQLKVS